MDLETYKCTYGEEDAPGWAAIDERLSPVYADRTPDFHFETLIGFRLGGPDPLDGTSI